MFMEQCIVKFQIVAITAQFVKYFKTNVAHFMDIVYTEVHMFVTTNFFTIADFLQKSCVGGGSGRRGGGRRD
jgi:hypothetical protein